MSSYIRYPTIKDATYVGSETCAGCHMKIAKFEVPGYQTGCEGCHGPGSKHAEEMDPTYIITFKNLNSFQASDVCLKCHSDAKMLHWGDSKHAMVGFHV